MTYAQKIKAQQAGQLLKLIEYFGGQTVLANKVGVSAQVVHNWTKRGRISASRAIVAETLTGGEFKKEQLRPDVLVWEK